MGIIGNSYNTYNTYKKQKPENRSLVFILS